MDTRAKIIKFLNTNDNIVFRSIDFTATLITVGFTYAFLITSGDENGGATYLRRMLSPAYLFIFVVMSLILLRMLIMSALSIPFGRGRHEPNGLEYAVWEQGAIDKPSYSLESMLTRQAKTVYITAQNWASSFSSIKDTLAKFIARDGHQVIAVLTHPEIMRLIFQSQGKGRSSNDCYAHYINPEGGTLSQIKKCLESLSPAEQQRISIYVHPGATSLSSHHVEYSNGRKVIVVTPKFATSGFPRAAIRIDSEKDKDAYNAICTELDTMSQPSNVTVSTLFKKYGIR